MGRFLSGLSWSQPVAAQAYGIGLSLPAVQALVGSRDAQVVHPLYSQNRVLTSSR